MSASCCDTSLDLPATVAIVVPRSERPRPVTDGLCSYGVAQRSIVPDGRYREQAAKRLPSSQGHPLLHNRHVIPAAENTDCPVLAGLDPVIGYPQPIANDAIPVSNDPLKMTGLSPVMTGWIVACGTSTARAVGMTGIPRLEIAALLMTCCATVVRGVAARVSLLDVGSPSLGRVNSPVRSTIALPLEGPLSRNPP
jgi:hypothetical protein